MNICETCGKETNNPKFCSRSCSAKTTNKTHPKRAKEGVCDNCGCLTHSIKKFCDNCYEAKRYNFENRIIGELTNKQQRIRYHARTVVMKNTSNKSCAFCGYDKHVEVCHIKPVSAFDEHCTVAEVNALENLILLCPNCHWEFDHSQENKNSQTP